MRHVVLIGVLAGCYSPATESCYYACATQGQPCPSGLECVAGNLCATKGETCSATIDSAPDVDAAPPVCGDGMRMPGEFCYGNPLTFPSAGGPPFDGVLADRNGDSRLDLLYLTSIGIWTHVNTGIALATTVSQGPSTNNARNMRPVQLNAVMGAELLVSAGSALESFAYAPTPMNYTRMGEYFAIPQVMTFEVAKMTDGGLGDVVVLDGSNLAVHRIESFTASTQISIQQVPFSVQNRVVVGQFANDVRSDVLLLSPAGITAFVGGPVGTSAVSTPVTTPVTDAAIGDVNGDGHGDIVFVVMGQGGAPGQIGVMLGNSTGTFSGPQLTAVPELGAGLEVVDLDNDRRDDVLAIRTGTAAERALLIYRGRTDGGVEPPVSLPLPGSSAKLSVRGSFNGDLVPDIVVTDTAMSEIYVYPSTP